MKAIKKSVYELVTESILEKLDKGVVPWHCPWNKRELMPKNLISNKGYNGINIMLLAMQGYKSQYWLSYNQAKNCDGNVMKGEKGSIVTFWKMLKFNDEKTGKNKTIPMLRYSRVFNLEQCENICTKRVKEEQEKFESEEEHKLIFDPIMAAEKIWEEYKNKPSLEHERQQAFYQPSSDHINMPTKESFNNEQEYYSTLFHEMGHSTGHKNRLNRDTLTGAAAFGSNVYSKEELVAEFCSSFLCAEAGILNHTVENSAAYIKGWSKKLRENTKLIIQGAGQGRKASEYILGIKPKEYEKEG